MARRFVTLGLVLILYCTVRVTEGQNDKKDLHRCPSGLDGEVRTFNEKCYRFVARDVHWNQAQTDCQLQRGNLVHIKDQTTQNFIYQTVKSKLRWTVNGMWIGTHDQRETNRWEWVRGSSTVTGDRVRYNNWAPGQPSCGILCIEHCGQMRFDDYGRWHDVQCHARFLFSTERYRYTCMYDMRPATTTTTTTTPAPTTTTTPAPTTTTATTNAATTTVTSTTTAAPPTEPPTKPSRGKSDRTTPIIAVIGNLQDQRVESVHSGVGSGAAAGIAVGSLAALVLLLLLLLLLLRRRRQKKPQDESASETFPNLTYSGAPAPTGHSVAFVNPQTETASYLNPTLSVRLPAKVIETKGENAYSECLDNEYNTCAALGMSEDDDEDFSKGIYEDIKLDFNSDLSDLSDADDDDDGLAKGNVMKTPSVEYLHARSTPDQPPVSPGPTPSHPDNLFVPDRQHVAQDNIYVPMDTNS